MAENIGSVVIINISTGVIDYATLLYIGGNRSVYIIRMFQGYRGQAVSKIFIRV